MQFYLLLKTKDYLELQLFPLLRIGIFLLVALNNFTGIIPKSRYPIILLYLLLIAWFWSSFRSFWSSDIPYRPGIRTGRQHYAGCWSSNHGGRSQRRALYWLYGKLHAVGPYIPSRPRRQRLHSLTCYAPGQKILHKNAKEITRKNGTNVTLIAKQYSKIQNKIII